MNARDLARRRRHNLGLFGRGGVNSSDSVRRVCRRSVRFDDSGGDALAAEVFDYLFGGLATDEGRELFDGSLRDLADGAEVSEQAVLPLLADAGYGRQLRGEVAQLA